MTIGTGDIVAVFFFGAAFGAWLVYIFTKDLEKVMYAWKKAAEDWRSAAEAWKVSYYSTKKQRDTAVAAMNQLTEAIKKAENK